jgi:hypothetical protein
MMKSGLINCIALLRRPAVAHGAGDGAPELAPADPSPLVQWFLPGLSAWPLDGFVEFISASIDGRRGLRKLECDGWTRWSAIAELRSLIQSQSISL